MITMASFFSLFLVLFFALSSIILQLTRKRHLKAPSNHALQPAGSSGDEEVSESGQLIPKHYEMTFKSLCDSLKLLYVHN